MLLHGQLVKRLTHRPLKATLTGSNPVLITIRKQNGSQMTSIRLLTNGHFLHEDVRFSLILPVLE